MMKRMLGRWIFLLLAGFAGSAASAQTPRIDLYYGLFRIDAEVAHRPAQQQQGLMHRREMAQHQGMLFVFDQDSRHCMWMRNTYIPLSVAFIDIEGRVVNIADMTPLDETPHCSFGPTRYALEMNRGWFEARGVKAGSLISGIDRAPAFVP